MIKEELVSINVKSLYEFPIGDSAWSKEQQ